MSSPLPHGGVDLNSALKRRNYGSIWNTGISIWTNSVHSNTKTNKDLKRKRNSRRESQRRVMHQTNPLNHGWVVSIVEVNHEKKYNNLPLHLYGGYFWFYVFDTVKINSYMRLSFSGRKIYKVLSEFP